MRSSSRSPDTTAKPAPAAVGDPHLCRWDPAVASSRRAVVRIDQGSLPAFEARGSRSSRSPPPSRIRSSQRSLLVGAKRWIGEIASEPCTETMSEQPASPARAPRQARIYAVALVAAQP